MSLRKTGQYRAVLEVVGDRAAASPELDGWPGEVDRAGRWLDALRAVCGEITGGAADDSLGLLVLALALDMAKVNAALAG